MSRKGNCIGNGATEQVFGHLKSEFFRGQEVARLRVVQGRPERLRDLLEHPKTAGQTEGTDPGGVPESVPWGAVHVQSALVVSRGKTYRYQRFLCATGSQICQAELRHTLVCPAWHRLCVRAPTPRFRAAAPTCGGIYHRASRAALPGFPAPPHNRLRAPQSCRHCQPCACDVR